MGLFYLHAVQVDLQDGLDYNIMQIRVHHEQFTLGYMLKAGKMSQSQYTINGFQRAAWMLVVFLSVAFSIRSEAAAADTWTNPHPGMRRLYRTTTEPNRINVLEVDLCRAGVAVRATKSAERKKTTSAFARSVGAQAAINGDFFNFSGYATSGLSIGEGEHWAGTGDGPNNAFAAFGKNRVEFSGSAESRGPESWMRSVVSGIGVIVENGVAITQNPAAPGHCSERHPRTAMGLSQDKRTLYMAVVDGRQPGVSRGMTCVELGKMMHSVGAYSAVNLDGGGSSAMWIEGIGLANKPSDASERVVANHLAVFAKGSAEPGSCDRSFEEAALQHSLHNASTTTDIDGDGRADACSLSSDGIECFLAGSTPTFSKRIEGPRLTLTSGWSNPANYSTIRYGDLNGDGKADICARFNAGVRCYLSTGTGFSAPFSGPELSNDSGWASSPSFYSTFAMADVNGDGKDDLCARASAGFLCYPSTGNGFSARTTILADLSSANGFTAPEYYGTIRMGDVNGDGKADVCARTKDGMRCWLSNGTAFPTKINGPDWSDAGGWNKIPYWTTIRMADVNGDGKADLCARGGGGFRCHLSNGNGFGAAIGGTLFPDSTGWNDHDNYSTIQLADVNGDGKLDVCARSNARMTCHLWTGNGWDAGHSGPAWSNEAGWDQIQYYSTIRMADINGDGKADLCTTNYSRFDCTTAALTAASSNVQGPAWGVVHGWNTPAQYTSVQLVDPPPRANNPDPIDPDPTEPTDPLPGEDAGYPDDIDDFTDSEDWADTTDDYDATPDHDVPDSFEPDDDHNQNNDGPTQTTAAASSCVCNHTSTTAPSGFLALSAALASLICIRRRSKTHA